MLSLERVCGQAMVDSERLHREQCSPLSPHRETTGLVSHRSSWVPQPQGMPVTCAHRTRQENERRVNFLGKQSHPSENSEGNPGGVTKPSFFPSLAAPPSWWNSPVRAVKVSATCLESTWGFSQPTSQPWSKAFWSDWWIVLHPTKLCTWRPSVRPVSPLHSTFAKVAPASSRQPLIWLMG